MEDRTNQPKSISILGVGLLGGSIALAAKSAINGCKINGYGHRQSTLDSALERGVIDQGFTDPQAAVAGCDLVILCTPVGLFNQLIPQIAPSLSPTAIVTDVGSTKRSVVLSAQKHLPNPGRFVGSHPIAGSEKRGVEFYRADLFQNALCLLTPAADTDRAALEAVEQFWQLLGMRIAHLTPLDHDRLLSDVSHLPHAVAAALVAIQSQQGKSLVGKGFLDVTRIAGGDGGLWRDIFLDNRDNLAGSIRRLTAQLERLTAYLEHGDEQAIQAWLDAAAAVRKTLDR